jgi:alkanesulfonate monooxygenase SsuD/methylene tetrahydromethanopterin reductase-like flavin-dependent oxidoreductase (luciferase family)
MPSLRFGVCYDFRCPPGSALALPDVYARTLDQAALADQLGYELIWFTEHHFLDDHHLPSFVPVAGAVAARTQRARLSTDIALMPFYHPVRLAEDLAILDNISGGRMEIGLGMGYATHEFAGFGVPIKRRVSLTEEGIDVLKAAWSGERFSYHGKRYDFDDLLVTPAPVQPGGPPIWIAAMSEGGAHRAARFDANLLPQGSREVVMDPWAADLRASGRDPSSYRVGIIRSCLVTDDAERDWPAIRDAERYRMRVYGRFFAASEDHFTAFEKGAITIPQGWVVGDVEHCVAELTTYLVDHGITDMVIWGASPGVDPATMAGNLERFINVVAPRVRANVDAARRDVPGPAPTAT